MDTQSPHPDPFITSEELTEARHATLYAALEAFEACVEGATIDLVNAETIRETCEINDRVDRSRAELCAAIIEAVAAAHQKATNEFTSKLARAARVIAETST